MKLPIPEFSPLSCYYYPLTPQSLSTAPYFSNVLNTCYLNRKDSFTPTAFSHPYILPCNVLYTTCPYRPSYLPYRSSFERCHTQGLMYSAERLGVQLIREMRTESSHGSVEKQLLTVH